MSPAKFVPVSQKSLDVVNLSNALPISCIVRAPERQNRISIVAIQIDSLLRDQVVDMIGHPCPRRGIAEVQQFSFTVAAKEPFRMVLIQPRSRTRALRNKPYDQFLAVGM